MKWVTYVVSTLVVVVGSLVSGVPGRTINSLGLILDILGGLILLKYGLPPQIDPEGHIHLILEQEDERQIELGKKYKARSLLGAYFLVLGFILQLISNYVI